MKSFLSLILIPAVLFASVVPASVYAVPLVDSTKRDQSTLQARDKPGAPDAPDDDQSDQPDVPTTTAPPPICVTSRADSIEVLERSLRAAGENKASTRLELSLVLRVRTHRKLARLEQLIGRARNKSTALRSLASRVRSHAPPGH